MAQTPLFFRYIDKSQISVWVPNVEMMAVWITILFLTGMISTSSSWPDFDLPDDLPDRIPDHLPDFTLPPDLFKNISISVACDAALARMFSDKRSYEATLGNPLYLDVHEASFYWLKTASTTGAVFDAPCESDITQHVNAKRMVQTLRWIIGGASINFRHNRL